MTSFTNSLYSPISDFPYKGRTDSKDNERVFQQIKLCNLNNALPQKKVAIAGFCSDEGVTRNLGRAGARLGPKAFRECFGRLALNKDLPLVDVGNINCQESELEEAQNALSSLVYCLHQQQNKTLLIGGGHEISYGHYLGLERAYPDKRIGILNFDAHFDLRSPENGASSGTPFRQIHQHLEIQGKPFDYACLGISSLANTNELYKTAAKLRVSYLSDEDLYSLSLNEQKKFIDDFCKTLDLVYVTICLDVFNQAYAPGVSAPQALGLAPFHVLPLLVHTLKGWPVISLDLAELSPPFDKQGQTARLASDLATHLLINW